MPKPETPEMFALTRDQMQTLMDLVAASQAPSGQHTITAVAILQGAPKIPPHLVEQLQHDALGELSKSMTSDEKAANGA